MPQSIPERLSELSRKFFPGWTLNEQIGSGSYSRVYKAQGKDGKQAALKWIEYPEDTKGIDELRARGASEEAVQEHRRHTLALLQQEIRLLEKLQGTPNIIEIYDHAVEQREEGGFDLLILMELAQPLTTVIPEMTVGEVRRLGQDICKALDVCEREKIMHRDIKPENIFRSQEGVYQLGDFGVARKVVGEQSHSIRGTPLYMAPEVKNGQTSYDHRVDIYSLGLVMYELLNAQCPPFVEGQGKAVTLEQEEMSIRRRLAGDPLPEPVQAPADLANIILRACSYDAEDRYESAAEMLQELEQADTGARTKEKLQGAENRPKPVNVIHNGKQAAFETQRALPRNTLSLDDGQRAGNAPPAPEPVDDEPEVPEDSGNLGPSVGTGDNPWGKKILDRKAKIRRIVMIIAAAAALAAIIFGVVLYLGDAQQMKALSYRQDGTLCNVSWEKGGGGPWQVTAVYDAEQTTVYSESTQQRNVQIPLFPGEEYTVTVKDQTLKAGMQEVPKYSGEVLLQAGTLCSYIEQAGAETVKRTPQSGDTITYSKQIGTEGQTGYEIRLRYRYPEAGGQPVEAECMLQYGNALIVRTITLAPSQEGGDAVVYIPLNEILKQGNVDDGNLKCGVFIRNTIWYEGNFAATRKD